MDGKPAAKLRARLLFENIVGSTEVGLLKDAPLVTYEAGATICDEGDEGGDLFVIIEGRVRFFLRRGHGQPNIYLDEQQAGEYFGELGVFDERARSATAEACVRTTCKVISSDRLLGWLRANPEGSIAMLRHASMRIRDLSDDLRASMSSAYERVVRFIMQVARTNAEGELLVQDMPSIAQLARMLGISRERTSLIVSDLVKGGFLEWRGHSLLVRRSLPEAY